ncbi:MULTISPECIES: primosomal replication protein [Erwiniaceae]|uniref:Prephenate dehydrogenase n=1 Tax=Pantoea rwandensis TaxID=1076550 RepID=A0ABM5RMG0_9GAMM|nr:MULTISPECIES: primosomal replication protein [Erwiniaceae]AIR87142.1 prephenate dehydrogenase [Pantoea rwandensis]MBK0093133.1 primosomal replication protein [Erwinia sp. S59]
MPQPPAHQRLLAIVDQLRQQISQQRDGACRQPRFDAQLFRCKGTRLADYLAELEQNLTQLNAADTDVMRRQWLAEKVLDQIAALQRECQSQQLRTQRERPRVDPRQSKREEYQGYETRLLAMIEQREQHLARAETLSVQQQLIRDIEVLHERLARCRHAMHKLELSGPAR